MAIDCNGFSVLVNGPCFLNLNIHADVTPLPVEGGSLSTSYCRLPEGRCNQRADFFFPANRVRGLRLIRLSLLIGLVTQQSWGRTLVGDLQGGGPRLGGQMNPLSVSIRPVVVVEKRRRYAAGEIPKARAK